jgi:hypothetical protein
MYHSFLTATSPIDYVLRTLCFTGDHLFRIHHLFCIDDDEPRARAHDSRPGHVLLSRRFTKNKLLAAWRRSRAALTRARQIGRRRIISDLRAEIISARWLARGGANRSSAGRHRSDSVDPSQYKWVAAFEKSR